MWSLIGWLIVVVCDRIKTGKWNWGLDDIDLAGPVSGWGDDGG